MEYALQSVNCEGIMQDSFPREGDETWPSSVRLTLIREECEELGMYLEGRKDCKRKWDAMDEREDKDRRPPKRAMGETNAGCAPSTHMSPGWGGNDLELELAGELSMNDALLSLPSLTVLKQEAPSPPGPRAPPRRWLQQRRLDDRQQMVVDVTLEGVDERQSLLAVGQDVCQLQPGFGPHSENKGGNLVMCSPCSSLDGLMPSPLAHQRPTVSLADSSFRDDLRFQYVLAAATSIATKTNEETLTYLNQGQPYEIKLKKLGDLSHYKGKILKSVIKICFHERRLQYMEREQMTQWHSERPGERIVEVDVPLSYGLIRVLQPSDPNALNSVEVLWDPTKDAGVYIKVNCISTEFTAKKHGGEKGVPFRVQVETFLPTHDADHRLHAAACQIKVFKLKGADRKHKQDREKVQRRPRTDFDTYQPGCEATVLTTLPNDAVLPPSLISTSPSSSPELCVTATKPGNVVVSNQASTVSACGAVKQLYEPDGRKSVSPPGCVSAAVVVAEGEATPLSPDASHAEAQAWLARQRLQHAAYFADFCGADLLRLSRDDLIQICSLADGIRLYNALHSKRIEPRLTVYVSASSGVFTALYLHSCTANELVRRLRQLVPGTNVSLENVLVLGPNNTRVYLTDDLVRHLPDNSTFRLQQLETLLLLTPTQQ